MLKYFLVLLSALLIVGAFRGGLEVGERAWSEKVAVAERQVQLSHLRGCVFAIDSDTLHFVRTPDVINLRRLLWRVNKCDSFLENLGTTELDEEISGVLGEIKLFLNGYQTTLKEIMGRQIMLEALYADLTTGDIEVLLEVEALEDLQTEQLQETMRFLDRIQLLATTIW
jgi:hypothetical protein